LDLGSDAGVLLVWALVVDVGRMMFVLPISHGEKVNSGFHLGLLDMDDESPDSAEYVFERWKLQAKWVY
jgi:hypothetical protein